MMQETYIKLTNVSKSFKDKQVIDNLSASFFSNEIVGIVAPNGSGKSTLFQLIMNFSKPSAGQILFKNELTYQSEREIKAIHQMITCLPDQFHLNNELTGRNYLVLYQKMWHTPTESVADLIAELEMSEFIDKKVGTYSLGMRQRLCFAMQYVTKTPIMLMDEITNGLDNYYTQKIFKLLKKLKAQGNLILIISHDLEQIEQLCNRVLFLKAGKIAFEYPNDTLDKTRYLFTKQHPLGTVFDVTLVADLVKRGIDFEIKQRPLTSYYQTFYKEN